MLINPGDIADGMLVNALWAVGQMAVRPRTSRRIGRELDVVGWMDTEALIRDGLPGAKLELPGLSEADAKALEAVLKRDEVQGALQALIAARLTDAPETDAARAREAVRLALSTPEPPPRDLDEMLSQGVRDAGQRYAGPLSEYFDDKISTLVADLEGRAGLARLSQIRAEAYNSRIVALLGAIELQLAALSDPGHGSHKEADFLERYQRQVRARHGYLVPPDFDRRRRVPIDDIYVASVIYDDTYPERTVATSGQNAPALNVWDLAQRLDRTVLLGDPGGGKTTAANVLANYLAGEATTKVPFLVTLRDYAAIDPPDRSVAGHVEYTLETLYQCEAPAGLIERLMITGRAVVIFDGLDELLDTSRRRDVSERVEQFCSAYPLAPVLVTSRIVGYEQARLDDEQFTCYRLDRFGDEEVAEYARKWFAVQEATAPAQAAAEANAFLKESASARDLRCNPLLLSLMCILYRGAGSLPRDRAGIYTRCAELLFSKWDEQRHIHRELRAGHLVEPAVRYLAWWLFTSEDSRAAVTERELIDEAASFLHGRAFESEAEARGAAAEFVEFCRGRMWVLTDVGTTANGEKLYAFTHRTFLEYFAAVHVAAVSDTPEELARALAPQLAAGKWDVVGSLAIQIKDRNSDRGTDRFYAILLDSAVAPGGRRKLLEFLASSLESTRPSPVTVRSLTRAVLDYTVGDNPHPSGDPLSLLLQPGTGYEQLIADEMTSRIADMVASDTEATRSGALQFIGKMAWDIYTPRFWKQWAVDQNERYGQRSPRKPRTTIG